MVSSLTLVYVCNQELMLNNQLTWFDFNVDSVLHVAHLESFRWGSLACEKKNFRGSTTQGQRELAHVSLFAGYWDLGAATTVETVLSGSLLSGHPLLSGQFSTSRKLLLLMYCNFDLY